MNTIKFSGYEWLIKEGNEPIGPGPNFFSKNCVINNVNGLKLQIVQSNNIVLCGEISSQLAFGYGTYYFYMDSRVDFLAPNLVLGLFIYKDDSNEIDIEFSKWDNQIAQNSQYVLQPSTPKHIHRFITKLNGDYSTHIFQWLPGELNFKSLHGHYDTPPNSNSIIQSWQYKDTDITKPTQQHKLHINLWRYQTNQIKPVTATCINYATINKFKFVKM